MNIYDYGMWVSMHVKSDDNINPKKTFRKKISGAVSRKEIMYSAILNYRGCCYIVLCNNGEFWDVFDVTPRDYILFMLRQGMIDYDISVNDIILALIRNFYPTCEKQDFNLVDITRYACDFGVNLI